MEKLSKKENDEQEEGKAGGGKGRDEENKRDWQK